MADKSMNGRFNVLRRRTSEIIHIKYTISSDDTDKLMVSILGTIRISDNSFTHSNCNRNWDSFLI